MQKVIGAIAVIWDWTARLSVALLGALALFVAATVTTTEFWILSPAFLFIGIYFVVTPFAPVFSARALGWIGRQLSRPYNRFFVPYVAEPVEASADVVGAVLERILVIAFKAALWIVGIIVVVVLGWVAFKGIAAVPVSVAVIVGALIIAGAVQSRRGD